MPKKKGKAKAGAATEAPPHRHEPRRMILCFVMFLCCVCFFLLLFSLGLWLLPWPGPLRACGVFGLCGSLCETTAQTNSAYFKRTPPPCAGSYLIDALNIGSSKVAWCLNIGGSKARSIRWNRLLYCERRDVRSAGVADWNTARGRNTERTLTAAAGPSPRDPYRHALTMRPPRKVRPLVS